MTTKRNNTNIELRNEEVQELMGKIPPAILRFGIFIIFFFFITIILVSFLSTILILKKFRLM